MKIKFEKRQKHFKIGVDKENVKQWRARNLVKSVANRWMMLNGF